MRVFDLNVVRCEQVSPSFKRVVFTGGNLHDLVDPAPDQRVRLLFPLSDGRHLFIQDNAEAIQQMRLMDAIQRPPARVYTVGEWCSDKKELSIDFVLHEPAGVASCWASQAKAGDVLQMLGVSRSKGRENTDFEWCPPVDMQHVFIFGDATALPAIVNILKVLQGWPVQPQALVWIEVPCAGDCRELAHWDGLDVCWLFGDTVRVQENGDEVANVLLKQAVYQAADQFGLERGNASCYVWGAGESTVVSRIRRYFSEERGFSKDALSIMGYWRIR